MAAMRSEQAATPEHARRANAELRTRMRQADNYFADIEGAAVFGYQVADPSAAGSEHDEREVVIDVVYADGRTERGNFPVFKRNLPQWMMRITAYADRLVDDPADQDRPLPGRQDHALPRDQVRQHPLQSDPALVARHPGELLQVDLVQQKLLEPGDLRVVGGRGRIGRRQVPAREAGAERGPHGITTSRTTRPSTATACANASISPEERSAATANIPSAVTDSASTLDRIAAEISIDPSAFSCTSISGSSGPSKRSRRAGNDARSATSIVTVEMEPSSDARASSAPALVT